MTHLGRIVILFLILIPTLVAYGQDKELFTSDVDTDQKPWTDLDFYNDPANFQFAIVSDNTGGMRPGIFEKGVEKLNMMMPEFVLSVGDLIQGYTQDTNRIREEWKDFHQKVEKLNVPFFYLPGNHDITNPVMQNEWEDLYGRRYYNFIYKDVLFIILDSNDDDEYNLSENQKSFIINTLTENQDVKWTFLLLHHPIWKYDTGGRFEEVEKALAGRKHTVIAGHEHRYQYIERNNSNYYVLATTGGGSALRGNRFGQFDHFVWVTMGDDGPIMANLRLDGILAHDISNDETAKMARSMLDNTRFDFLVLTNQGDKFTNGTAYLHFRNKSNVPLNVDLSFFHHHQVNIQPAVKSVRLEQGREEIIQIELKANEPIDLAKLGFVRYYWRLSYEGEEFEDFFLDGTSDFAIRPSTPDYFFPQTPQFVEDVEITFNHPYHILNTEYSTDEETNEIKRFPESLNLAESSTLNVFVTNEKGENTTAAVKSYNKVSYLKGQKVRKAIPGLSYHYYEGKWPGIPEFSEKEKKKSGIVKDFLVGDIADVENDFGIRYFGYIEIPEDGLYFFRCKADDAGFLKIHNTIVCLDGKSEIYKDAKQLESHGAIALKKGMHPVQIDFIENQGSERLRFYYKLSEDADWIFMDLEDFFRTKIK